MTETGLFNIPSKQLDRLVGEGFAPEPAPAKKQGLFSFQKTSFLSKLQDILSNQTSRLMNAIYPKSMEATVQPPQEPVQPEMKNANPFGFVKKIRQSDYEVAAAVAVSFVAKSAIRLTLATSGIAATPQLVLIGAGGGAAVGLYHEFRHQQTEGGKLTKRERGRRFLSAGLKGAAAGAIATAIGASAADLLFETGILNQELILNSISQFKQHLSLPHLTLPPLSLPHENTPPVTDPINPAPEPTAIIADGVVPAPVETPAASQIIEPRIEPFTPPVAPDLPDTPQNDSFEDEIIPVKYGDTVWGRTKEYLQGILHRSLENNTSDDDLLQRAAEEVSRQSNIIVSEWGIDGTVDSRDLREGRDVFVFGQKVRELALAHG